MGQLTYATQEVQDRLDAVGTFVRPNLLDNAYFIGGGSQSGTGLFPINQRGSSTYSSSSNQIAIDRWMLTIGTGITSMSDSGMTILTTGTNNGRSLRQAIENPNRLAGRTVTMSALVGNVTESAFYCTVFAASSPHGATQTIMSLSSTAVTNGLISVTGVINNDFTTYPNLTAYIGFLNTSSGIGTGATAQIKAAKLELGDTQTLAHWDETTQAWVLNEAPNYAEELYKCRRYYYRLASTSTDAYCEFATGIVFNTDAAVYIPTHLRTKPSVTYGGNLRLVVCDSAGFHVATDITAINVGASSNGLTKLTISSSAITSYKGLPMTLTANNTQSAWIALSSDL